MLFGWVGYLDAKTGQDTLTPYSASTMTAPYKEIVLSCKRLPRRAKLETLCTSSHRTFGYFQSAVCSYVQLKRVLNVVAEFKQNKKGLKV